MSNERATELLLSPLEAAYHLGITSELLFQYTKRGFTKASGIRTLAAVDSAGQTRFARSELDAFDALLASPWPSEAVNRPTIPKAILDHLRAESLNQCARCASGIGVDTAHIRSWAESRSHHHANLLRLCSSCHREHDAQHSLSTEQLVALKAMLVARTRSNLSERMRAGPSLARTPRPSSQFVGRDEELRLMVDALRSGRSAIVSGVGGIGKTELLAQALNRAETGRPVLWIDVDQFRTTLDVISALRAALATNGVACSEDAIGPQLDELQACLVFDGIERGLASDLEELEDAIASLFAQTHNCQFISTTQVQLHRLPGDIRLKLGKLDKATSQVLLESLVQSDFQSSSNDLDRLLDFCDGHALTLRLASALVAHYGSPSAAFNAIERNGAGVVQLPGRRRQDHKTSLALCLQTAYAALTADSRQMLWALAESPAGIFTHYLDGDWLDLEDSIEALASLRRWHLVDLVRLHEDVTRTHVLAPVRAFATARGQEEEAAEFEAMIGRLVRAHGMMVAVFELNYDDPNDTPYVLQRYGDELPNFLHVLELARARQADTELVTMAVSIVRSLMRYFFVLRLPDQGVQVMRQAADLALSAGLLERASGLIVQTVGLAQRSGKAELLAAGLALVDRIESLTEDPEILADIAISRAIAAREGGDNIEAERHARLALDGYRARLRKLLKAPEAEKGDKEAADFERQDLHNDISTALGILGFSLLSQRRFDEAATAYRHSLEHSRGASIAVNRGQTLHQIGNCESNLGNHAAAARLYVEAAEVFHFVGMEEFLSNALGELGYTLLDVDLPEALESLGEEILERGLDDLATDVKRAFDPEHPLDHANCARMLRKLFGTIILISLTAYGHSLAEFCTKLANETLVEIGPLVETGMRDSEEMFPLLMLDLTLKIGILVAEAEYSFVEDGDISRETIGDFLKILCNAHSWAQNVMRLVDWFSVFLTRRWQFEGATTDRLRAFIKNYENDVVDYFDLSRGPVSDVI